MFHFSCHSHGIDFLQGSLIPFIQDWHLETKIWLVGVPIVAEILLLGSEQTELGSVCVYVCVRVRVRVHTHTNTLTTHLYLFCIYPSIVKFLIPVQQHRIPSSFPFFLFVTPSLGC